MTPTERAQALEQALRMLRNECAAIRAMSYDAIKDSAGYTNLKVWIARIEEADALLAVPPPPPAGASPQAETSDLHLWSFDIVQAWLSGCQKPDCHPCFECSAKLHAIVKGLLANQPAPVSPVEPEPPTTCRCLDCEPLTDPGPKPSEDDINRLEKAAWDSKTDLVLVWYRDRAEMFRQRLRETERAWQLDRKKPTVEPEPCVWRAIATVPKDGTRILLTPAVWTAERVVSAYYRLGMWWIESADARGSIRAFTDPDEDASHWPFTHWTPLPGAPLKVER